MFRVAQHDIDLSHSFNMTIDVSQVLNMTERNQ